MAQMLARSLAVDTIKRRCRVVASKLVQSQYSRTTVYAGQILYLG
jgi:hypothetical protein